MMSNHSRWRRLWKQIDEVRNFKMKDAFGIRRNYFLKNYIFLTLEFNLTPAKGFHKLKEISCILLLLSNMSSKLKTDFQLFQFFFLRL
jgi:hypothetical protein